MKVTIEQLWEIKAIRLMFLLSLLASTLIMGSQPEAAAVNPTPVQLFYIPFPESQLYTGLQVLYAGTTPPMETYVSIAAIADNTVVYYDQWENGYDADIANPLNLYSAGNPGGTQIWGDGDPSNGAPPGVPSDIINAGTVIVLSNPVDITTPLVIDFDGRDKIAATKNIAITHVGWADNPGSVLAGAVEVFDTSNWGTDYRAPVGQDIPDNYDFQMFEYTSLAIMAGEGGANVQIDKDADGTFETIVTINEGESYFVNGGVNVGGHVVSDKPVQVDILTGDIGGNYESRDSGLLPTDLWSNDYYTPVSTVNANATTVWLYNPKTTPITVQYITRVAGVLTTTLLTVPGGPVGGYLKQVFPNGYGAHFSSADKFYAFSTTDSNSGNASGAGNQTWDWGYSLIPDNALTSQVLIGLGIGQDPTRPLTEDGNPIWVTPVGNGDTPVTVYVDFDADPTTGALTDPNGNKYDQALSLKELERAEVRDLADLNQTGTLLYALTPGVKLAVAWGQDPLLASAGEPGLDVGTGVPPAPVFSAGKNGTLYADNDGDGFVSPGDELLFTISINNVSRAPVPNILLQDNLPDDTTYVANSTFFKNASNVTTQISDDGVGTPFPLDGSGVILDPITALPVGGSYEVTFRVIIDSYEDLTPGTTQILNTGLVSSGNTTVVIRDTTPIYGRIGDFVWADTNGNGLQDAGEPGVGSVTVNLLDGSGNLITSTTTNASGSYEFFGVPAGTYIIQFVAPPDSTFTTQDADGQGINGANNSDADQTTGRTIPFTLQGGEPNNNVDAGLVAPSISVVKSVGPSASGPWDDANSSPGPSFPAGSDIYFQYVITNTGSVPLSGVALTDSVYTISPTPTIPDPLAPGSIYTYIYGPVIAAAGQHTNIATVNGATASGTPVTDDDPANYFGTVPTTIVTSLNPQGPITAGQTVTDQITISSMASGALPVPGGFWTVEASKDITFSSGVFPVDEGSVNGPLPFNATTTAWAPPSAGTWYFRATYSGDANYDGSQSNPKDETLVVKSICVSIDKQADRTTAFAGDQINYTFTICNCGQVKLTVDSVIDSKLGDLTADFIAANGDSTLAVGKCVTFSKSYTVQASDGSMLINFVTVTAHNRGIVVSDSDRVSVELSARRCFLPVTLTQQGWHNFCASVPGVPGGLVYNLFPTVFAKYGFYSSYYANQVIIGAPQNKVTAGSHSLTFIGKTSGLSQLCNFLPQTGPCDRLWGSFTNQSYVLNKSGAKTSNVLAGEVLALTLNIAYNDMRLMPRSKGYDLEKFTLTQGVLKGKTVGQVLKIGNSVLAGVPPCSFGLTGTFTQGCATLVNILQSINANYEFVDINAFIDRGYLKPNVALGQPGAPHPMVVPY